MLKNKIYVSYGDNPKKMIFDVLSSIKIENFINKDAFIGIKPNLVVAKPSTSGATTSPELLEGVIRYLKSKGFENIVVLEGSWVGDRTSKPLKYADILRLQRNLMSV